MQAQLQKVKEDKRPRSALKDHSFERLCIVLSDRFAERLIYYSKMYQSFSGAVFRLSVWQLFAVGDARELGR